jgi:hypothetical protein
MFLTDIFNLLEEQTNIYYQQHLDIQAGLSRRLPDFTLLDMMTFVALALQMGNERHTMNHELWSRLRQIHTPFYGETMTLEIILHITAFSAFCRQFTET